MSEQRSGPPIRPAAMRDLPQEARFKTLMTEMMSAVNYADPASLLEAVRRLEQVLEPYFARQVDIKRRELAAIQEHRRRLGAIAGELRAEAERIRRREDVADFEQANATRIGGGPNPEVSTR